MVSGGTQAAVLQNPPVTDDIPLMSQRNLINIYQWSTINLLRATRVVGNYRTTGDENLAAVGFCSLDVDTDAGRDTLIAVVVRGYSLQLVTPGIDVGPGDGVRGVGSFADFGSIGKELDLGD